MKLASVLRRYFHKRSKSSVSRRSSKAKKGGEWTNTLHFTMHDRVYDSFDTVEKTDNDLLSYFDTLGTKREEIKIVEIFKNNLSLLPIFAGSWHEFIVVQSTNWFWSFEKQNFGICVQRSKDKSNVKCKLQGDNRTGKVKGEGRDAQGGRGEDTIYDIINWIYKSNYVTKGYHVTDSNCHHFASLLFEAIARQKGRQL